MKNLYDVYYFNRNSNDMNPLKMGVDGYDRACNGARTYSLEDGVSECLVYDNNGALVSVWVDGVEVDLQEYINADLCDDYDEVDEIGYNPYIGGYDMDC